MTNTPTSSTSLATGVFGQKVTKEELADVFIYSIMLADNLGLNIEKIIDEKLENNAVKYPVENSKGSNKKYNEL